MVRHELDANQRRILVFTSAAHFLTHFFVLAFPALVMPISRDLQLDPGDVIRLGFPMYLCYGIFAIPWGYLSDRVGARYMMGAGVLIAGLGFLGAGVAESTTGLVVALGAIGVGCSSYHPAGLALLSKGMTGRGRSLGINGLWGNCGIASAPLAAGTLAYGLGWQGALLVLGSGGIALGLLCLAVPFSVGAGDLQRGTVVERRRAVTYFLVLCAAMVLSGLMYRGYTIILPAFFEVRLAGLSAVVERGAEGAAAIRVSSDADTLIATLVTSSVYVLGMLGQLLGGHVADRYDLRWAYLAFFACALPFLLLMRIADGPLLIAAGGGFVLFSLGMQPIENSLVAVLTPARWRSVGYGFKFTLVFGAGSLAIYCVSFVEARWGLDGVLLLLAGFLVGVILMIVALLVVSRGSELRHEH